MQTSKIEGSFLHLVPSATIPYPCAVFPNLQYKLHGSAHYKKRCRDRKLHEVTTSPSQQITNKYVTHAGKGVVAPWPYPHFWWEGGKVDGCGSKGHIRTFSEKRGVVEMVFRVSINQQLQP